MIELLSLNRREILALGALFALPAGISSCSGSSGGTKAAEKLAPDQIALIGALGDRIIPATDTPGATGAGVPSFIAMLYEKWMLPEQQAGFLEGLTSLDMAARMAGGKIFASSAGHVQKQLLDHWENEADQARSTNRPDTFYARLKAAVLVGYYTSAAGQEQELGTSMDAGQGAKSGPVADTVAVPLRWGATA